MIKKCPFCGSDPRVIERKGTQGRFGIGCTNSECIIFLPPDVKKRELHNYVWCWADKNEMIRKWNRRMK